MDNEASRLRAYSIKNNHIALEDYVRNQHCVSKSVHSDNQSWEGNLKNKKNSRSDIKDLKERERGYSRMGYSQIGKINKKGSLRMPGSIEKTGKQRKAKLIDQNQTAILRPSDLEKESEMLLKTIIQKERILRDLDKRIEMKMSQWLIFQAEVNRKMASYNSQLSSMANLVETQKMQLNNLKAKVVQTQQIFNVRCAQIAKRKQEVEELCKFVQRTTKQQDAMKAQLETQKQAWKAKMAEIDVFRKQLEQKQMTLQVTSKKVHDYQQQILQSMAALQSRQKQIATRQKQLLQLNQKHISKTLELDQRQKVISSYVNQLNSCISTLSMQRSSLLNINTNLEKRCNQLENLEIKLFRKVMDEEPFERYLTDSTNIESRTPVRRNKQNMITFTEKKKRREQRSTTAVIEQRSTDLLSDSPLQMHFDFTKLN